MMPATRCRLLLGFAVSLLANIPSGLDLAFNVFAIDLKQSFNFTQTQVEVVGSFSAAGLGFGALEGVLLGYLGYKWTYVAALFLSTVPAFLLYLTVLYRDVFTQQTMCIGLLLLINSAGNTIFSILTVDISLRNFSAGHVGRLVGAYLASTGLGKFYYAGLLDIVCMGNFDNFFGLVAASCVFLYGLCFVLHRPVETETKSEGLLKPKSQTHKYETVEISSSENARGDTYSRQDMLKSAYFHALFWTSLFVYAAAFTMMNNITYIAQSIHVHNPLRLVYVLCLVIVTLRLTIGTVFDYFQSDACGFALLQTCTCAIAVALIIALLSLNAWSVYVISALVGFSLGGANSLPVSLLVSRFGRERSSDIIGPFYSVFAVIFLLYQVFVGKMYDRKASQQDVDDSFCFGSDCFHWAFVALLAIIGLSIIVHSLNFIFNGRAK